MFKTLKNAWKIPELQKKILFTLLIVLLYRIGCAIPVPFVNAELIKQFATQYNGTILQFMSTLSGGALAQATLFALSVSPYITASIVIQLLTIAFPKLGEIAKNGEEGQQKVKKWTRWVTIGLALVTAYGYTMLLANGYNGTSYLNGGDNWGIVWGRFWATNGFIGTLNTLAVIGAFCAGAAIIMWMAELVDSKGIGNGISIILFFNILSRVPYLGGQMIAIVQSFQAKGQLAGGIAIAAGAVIILLAMIILIVWVTESERRIPIQYAKRVVGRKMYGGQGSNLPIKLNMSGVMPIIFASSIVSIPATIATLFFGGGSAGFNAWFGPQAPLYIIVYLVLIIAFSYFYIMISFNPVEVANNIKNNGGSVPGIRPGRATVDYIKKILNRITLIGALFLIIVAGLPMVLGAIFPDVLGGISFSGNSLLIAVGVALETFRDIEAQITMRNYKGFLD